MRPMILLVRVDPEKNANRWYSVSVQPTLLDGCAVLCLWGSRRTVYQRGHIIPVGSPDEAQSLAEQIVARKLRRGYFRSDFVSTKEAASESTDP